MKRIVFFTLCVLIAFLTSVNAGVMYNCTDRDGKSIFTDTPQDGMKCDLKSDDSNVEILPNEQTRQKYEQIGNTRKAMKTPKTFKPVSDPVCIQEYEKNMDKQCVEDVTNKIRSSLSPLCREFVESSHKEEEPYKDCKREIVMGVNRLIREVEKCNQLPTDSKCREQVQGAIRRRIGRATKDTLK